MRLFLLLLSASVLLPPVSSAAAGQTGSAAVAPQKNTRQPQRQPRFGVVDMQQVILAVKEGKQARLKLEREIKAKEKLLKQSREELEKLNKELQAQAALLSETAKFKKQQKFQEKFLSLRNAEMEFQVDIKRKEQQATKKIAVKVAKLVEKVARARQLAAVFGTSSAGLLYVRSPVNLTQQVIEMYDKKFTVQ